MLSRSPASDADRTYPCAHCPKRYARKDYLERHELNHTRPASICPACGKGFARPDVLRKHLSTSCKSRRNSAGEAPVPLTTAEQDALVPRKRRRPQRRQRQTTDATSASIDCDGSSGTDETPTSHATTPTFRTQHTPLTPHTPHTPHTPQSTHTHHTHRRRYSAARSYSSVRGTHDEPTDIPTHGGHGHGGPVHRSSGMDGRLEHPGSGSGPLGHRVSEPDSNPRPGTRPSLDLDARFGVRNSFSSSETSGHLVSPTLAHAADGERAAGTARAGAGIDVPLARAFDATPETLGNLSFASTAGDEWGPGAGSVGSVPIGTGSAGDQANKGARVDIPGVDDVAVSSVDMDGVYPDSSSLQAMPGVEDTWNASNEVGNNMDDLFSWLFNLTYATSSRSMASAASDMPDNPLSGEDAPSATDSQVYGHSHELARGERTGKDQPLHTLLHQHGCLPTPGADTGASTTEQTAKCVCAGRMPPQQTHPRAQKHTGATYPFPPFPEAWEAEAGARQLPPRAEVLDAQARDDILGLFEGAARDDLLSPAFSLSHMRLYFELYFMHFAPLYPIIHRASLGYRRLPPDLLLTILCIGTAFAENKEGFRIATRIHKRLRNRVFEMVEDEPRAPIATLQTILLINHFSRSYCSLKEHDVAQIFHSPSIIMARLSGVFLPSFSAHHVSHNQLDHWLAWVKYEERKRCGWLAFMMDTESAALFRHYLLVHCFSVEIDWPSDDAVWSAADPFTWSTTYRASPRLPSFRHALREIASRGTIDPSMSEINLWILLHGVISVSWTLLWRDLGDLSMVHEKKVTLWKDSLRRAFGAFRDHTRAVFAKRVAEGASPLDVHVYWAGIPFAHLGCILLLSDTESIRIFAGASTIAGRPISPGEWANASAYVGSWARSQDGAYSCYAAVELLHEVFKWSHESRFLTAPSVIPWCLYIASLIIWAYSTVLEGPDRLAEPYLIPTSPTDPHEAVHVNIEPSLARRDALDYLARLVQATPFELPDVPDKNRCAGVIAYTAYLAGTLGRGVMDESRNVLMQLLTKSL